VVAGFTTKDKNNVPTLTLNPQFKSMQGKMRKGYIEASAHDPKVDETNKKAKQIVIIEFLQRYAMCADYVG
jgi:hypothetical protein